jgi:hypothetical protein
MICRRALIKSLGKRVKLLIVIRVADEDDQADSKNEDQRKGDYRDLDYFLPHSLGAEV